MDQVLVINSGSSSVKAAIFEGAERKLRVEARQLITPNATLRLEPENTPAEEERIPPQSPSAAIDTVLRALETRGWMRNVVAVGHRIVHGGREFREPTLLTPYVLEVVRGLVPLAPLHEPSEIAAMEEIARVRPDLPQVLCFDTSFHRTMPAVAERYPLPQELYDQGVARYGFHGLSYEWIVTSLKQRGTLPHRMIVAHLGNGCSMAAVLDGKGVDTTMGLTALCGLPMATRPGDLDPGVLLYLQRELGYSLEKMEELLYTRSGLLGISGKWSDVQDLLAQEANSPSAALALKIFCYSVQKTIGAYAAVLGGVDVIVFTGGIGQYASSIRERVLAPLAFLGIDFDPGANAKNAPVITTPSSRVRVEMIAANEEAMIALHTLRVCKGRSTQA